MPIRRRIGPIHIDLEPTMDFRRFMGLDLSTTSGVVVLGVKPGETEPEVLHQEITTASTSGITRAQIIANRIRELALRYMPDRIVIENYGFANAHSLVTLVEIGTLVRDRLSQAGFRFELSSPNQVKKFVLGKGSGKKDMVRLGAYKRWKFENDSDDIVDAYVLARIAHALMMPASSLTAPQLEVISAIKNGTAKPKARRKEARNDA